MIDRWFTNLRGVYVIRRLTDCVSPLCRFSYSWINPTHVQGLCCLYSIAWSYLIEENFMFSFLVRWNIYWISLRDVITQHRLMEWKYIIKLPDNKVHGTNMGPTWVLSAPFGPHIGPMDLAIRVFVFIGWCVFLIPYDFFSWFGNLWGLFIDRDIRLILKYGWVSTSVVFTRCKYSCIAYFPCRFIYITSWRIVV